MGDYYLNRFFDVTGAKNTLEENRLRFTRMDYLNDPLDGSVLIMEDAFINYACNRVSKNLSGNSIAKSRSIRRKVMSEINAGTNPVYTEIRDNYQKKNFTCSFSKHYDNDNSFLLWSYYSDSHQGVCIQFDKDCFDIRPIEINYPGTLRSLPSDYFITKLEGKEIDIRLLFGNKKEYWKHEDEVRYLLREKALRQNDYQYEVCGENNEYLKIELPLNSIRKVIFGCKLGNPIKEEILGLLGEIKYSVLVEEMYLDKNLCLKSRPFK